LAPRGIDGVNAAITAGERAYVHRLVSRLRLTLEEARQVEGWLRVPPSEDEVGWVDMWLTTYPAGPAPRLHP